MRSLVIDPFDQNFMIFMDNSIVKVIDLSTLVVTELIAGMSSANALDLLGGMIYGCWH